MERGKACPDTFARKLWVVRGRAPSSRNCEVLSTDAGRAGGPVRSSDEASVALPPCPRNGGRARWIRGYLGSLAEYAGDGHGGNSALRQLTGLDPSYRSHVVFSILRVFGPEALKKDLNAAEAHCKDALLSRTPSR